MKLRIGVNGFLALFVLLGVKISSLLQQKECPLSTVTCTENSNFKVLHSNISWNCTSASDSTYIYLSCKESEERNDSILMCCKVSIQKENNRLTAIPASCLGIFKTRAVRTIHSKTVQVWNCEWEWSAIKISGKTLNHDVSHKLGIYYHDYHCFVPHNNTFLQKCHMKQSTTAATSLPTVKTSTTFSSLPSSKWRNGSFAVTERLTSLGKTLIAYVNQSTKCTVSMIQELLMKMEDRVRLFLRAILNTSATVLQPYFNKFIELHGVIITNISKTLKVPDPLEAGQSQGFFSLPQDSIDIKNGRMGIVTVVFKFEELCKDTRDLELDSSETKRSSFLQSPIVSVLAMTEDGSVHALQKKATLSFRIKSANRTSIRCIFLNHTSSSNRSFWSDNGMTFMEDYEDNFTTCLTNHLTSFAVLMDYNDGQSKLQLTDKEKLALDLITKIGCSFAIFCLVACILTFACVRGLSAVRYQIHLNLCVALAAAQLLFVTGIDATKIKGVCTAVAVMLHYFFTASFTWMCVEAIHMFSKIVSVFNIQTIRMRYYMVIGWGIPAVIVAISVIVHYEGYGTSKLCWLSLEGDLIWAFLTPVVIIVSINAFVLVAIIVVRVSLKGNPLSPSDNKKFAAALKTVVVLFPLLGLCWVFGLVGVMTNSRPFLYAFVILSSLQGFFILVFHCIGNTEVRGSIKALKNRHSLESSVRQEQKKRLQETRRVQNNDSSATGANSAERKSLIASLPGLKKNGKQKEEATNV